ncbi:hypothetical protein LINPERHAP2_LOCUS14439 [Linum perenne]
MNGAAAAAAITTYRDSSSSRNSVLPLCTSLFAAFFFSQMGSSYVLGGSKNVISGVESGWTDYIGSSFQSSYSEADDAGGAVNHYSNGGYGSDDSMVSDASSGPSHSEAPSGQKKGGFCSWTRKEQKKKLGKQGKGRDEELRIKEEEDVKSAASHTGSKVMKAK